MNWESINVVCCLIFNPKGDTFRGHYYQNTADNHLLREIPDNYRQLLVLITDDAVICILALGKNTNDPWTCHKHKYRQSE